jgi:hypothetical protein
MLHHQLKDKLKPKDQQLAQHHRKLKKKSMPDVMNLL